MQSAFLLLASSVAVLGDPALRCAKVSPGSYLDNWTDSPLKALKNTDSLSRSPNTEACPGGVHWRRFEDKCYYASTSDGQPKRTWHVAEAFCRQHKGHLASIHSKEEDLFIRQQFQGIPALRIWIGLNKLRVNKEFRWSDNSLMTYSHWQPGEPNDSFGAEHCIHVYNNTGTWNDMNCARLLPFACEQSYNGDPPPTFIPPPSTSGRCPQNFTKIEAKCFYAETNELFSLRAAEQQCKANHPTAFLATVDSPFEQALLQSLLLNDSVSSYWIGMAWTYCDFQWRSGQPLTFTNWAPNQPSGGESSPCVVMNGDGTWDDVKCEGTSRGYVCETPTSPGAGESAGDYGSTPSSSSSSPADYVKEETPSGNKSKLLLEVVPASVGAVAIITLAAVGAVLFCRRRKLTGRRRRGIESQVILERDDVDDIEMSFEIDENQGSKGKFDAA